MVFKFFRISILVYFLINFGFYQSAYSQSPESKLQVGDEALNFEGVDQFGGLFELDEALEKGPVVLLFYRGHWCPYCNKQLSQMEDSLSFIIEKGGTVVAVTPEKPEYIKETIEKTGASFLIVHDADLSIMKKYGVSFELSDVMTSKYLSRGRDLNAISGGNGNNLPVPATYIISKQNKILFAFYDTNYKKRATVGKILQNL